MSQQSANQNGNKTKTVIVTGAGGQLGYELQQSVPAHVNLVPLNSAELDITQSRQINLVLEQYQPACIINAALTLQLTKQKTTTNKHGW